jgi:hypothetical protein
LPIDQCDLAIGHGGDLLIVGHDDDSGPGSGVSAQQLDDP